MDNQHRKILGYRDLSTVEISMMNRIKTHAQKTKELLTELEEFRAAQLDSSNSTTSVLSDEQIIESARCLEIAKEKLQTGNMWFVRAVALPASF